MFDGLHLGHHSIIERVKKAAVACNGESFLFSFSAHPRNVLFPQETDLKLLTDPIEKNALLSRAGVQHLLLFPFDLEFSKMEPEHYVKKILVDGLHAHTLVVGFDHRFGAGRKGDVELLKFLGKKYGFEVDEISALEIGSNKISSSLIRKAILNGEIEKANAFLGRKYSFRGKVLQGKKLGKEIGFPTANLRVADRLKLIPKTGVYAVSVEFNNLTFKGMMNIGTNPTISSDNNLKIEVNLFNFEQNIYEMELEVFVHNRLRDEVKFSTVGDLVLQLKMDKQNALSLL